MGYFSPTGYSDEFPQEVAELVTLPQVRDHLQLDPDDTSFDDLLNRFVISSRQVIENTLRRPVVRRSRIFRYTRRPTTQEVVEIAISPVQQVTDVRYQARDSQFDSVFSASVYSVDGLGDNNSLPVTMFPVATWPSTNGAVLPHPIYPFTVTAEVGYANPPMPLIQALLQIVADWYLSREATSAINYNMIPYGARKLLQQYSLQEPWLISSAALS